MKKVNYINNLFDFAAVLLTTSSQRVLTVFVGVVTPVFLVVRVLSLSAAYLNVKRSKKM